MPNFGQGLGGVMVGMGTALAGGNPGSAVGSYYEMMGQKDEQNRLAEFMARMKKEGKLETNEFYNELITSRMAKNIGELAPILKARKEAIDMPLEKLEKYLDIEGKTLSNKLQGQKLQEQPNLGVYIDSVKDFLSGVNMEDPRQNAFITEAAKSAASKVADGGGKIKPKTAMIESLADLGVLEPAGTYFNPAYAVNPKFTGGSQPPLQGVTPPSAVGQPGAFDANGNPMGSPAPTPTPPPPTQPKENMIPMTSPEGMPMLVPESKHFAFTQLGFKDRKVTK